MYVYENSMADREGGSSSEDNLSDESNSNLVILYDERCGKFSCICETLWALSLSI